ncbi:hypothetical protein UT300011_26740 [Clostridium perfringens]|uniref:hypothetical protein n=1 Tax=Clostridium perfringens TaxID=1502 RepID=UPI0024BC4743|nr:hypothetical protein [Clostridium perfringens]
MGKLLLVKLILKSIGIATFVIFSFLIILGNISNGKDTPIFIIALSIISTMIFCTFIIIDKINSISNK